MSATAEAANIIEDNAGRKSPRGYWRISTGRTIFGYLELGTGYFTPDIPRSWHLYCCISKH